MILVPLKWLLVLVILLVEPLNALDTYNLQKRLGKRTIGEECSTPYNKAENDAMRAQFANVKQRRASSPQGYTINVNVNVVATNMTYEGGWVPNSQIEDQITALNKAYSKAKISFSLFSIKRIIWPTIFEALGLPDSIEQQQMASDFGTLFRSGDATTLNINLVGFLTDEETYGYGMPPTLYDEYPELDGIYIRHNSLPGGSSPIRQGSTVIHETGHWFALWHTFQNGCAGDGDGILDTPAEASAASGCPTKRDSCPDDSGLDPIHNWMDYSDEGCRDSFTDGQMSIMNVAAAYRFSLPKYSSRGER